MNVFVPELTTWSDNGIMVYVFSTYLIISSVIILVARNYKAFVALGVTFVTLFLLVHVPFRFQHPPNNLGLWTLAIKCLVLGGGSFVALGTMHPSLLYRWRNVLSNTLQRFGIIVFGCMLILFGMDHFLYPVGVSSMIPRWISSPEFWTYFSGGILITSGIAVVIGIKRSLVSVLMGTMIFIWVLVLHLPGAIAQREVGSSHALSSTFHALAFSGIALMISGRRVCP
jgi:uncharacterized membrane protein YphA (DoxX/SURF4 family)